MIDGEIPGTDSSDLGEADAADASLLPEPSGWNDQLSGADGPRYWDRMLSREDARLRRHGGRATVVLVELSGFEDLAAQVGQGGVQQAFARLSRVLTSEIRSSDQIARIGTSRFGILLIESDEVHTLNFVDRLLRACRTELERDRSPVRVGVGWSSPAAHESLAQAMVTAEARLEADFFRTKTDRAAG